MALQNSPQAVGAFFSIMRQLLGEENVSLPTNPAFLVLGTFFGGGSGLLDQFELARCASCNKLLCKACIKGTTDSPGCILCEAPAAKPKKDLDTAALQSFFNKAEGATIAASITKLESATDAEFQQIQEIVLNSARKLERDVKIGGDVQFLGLALLEFCDAIEQYPDRPINRPVLQQIRDLAVKALPEGPDPSVVQEFRQAVEKHIKQR
jgi:hypothetical protein